ncbi:hypothetical protein BD780_001150 [Clostridium tetanomorphum]|uniref:Conjugal transfer protein TraX n=1 Tax=Clostridium tetanomorphum TaxID=1553 RepID=A0A923EBK4_CLOTT|nr:TraX family protein [Clostridium tetanomorphum]KAJ49651.1 TraX family protein [Clostridium tetanomorphum DSM 665]KAJ52415.1 TraX family protein [Clostridium tetanomorphum DSM 665]MBC2397934.1 conjugal transfer protein TraX [Clostridium tetanomorphum]MBP1864748.1 hypothetical protein [Clostridium tetanomorphum]NRS83925.1 hypothetical protein [Clostridium tetanomorphum]
MKIFNSFQLKVIMVIVMFIDHVGEFIVGSPLWLRYIGRLAAPVFFYLLVEGFFHTSSRKKYMERLFIGGVIMLLVSTILMYIFKRPVRITNNIFLSMGFSIALLTAIEGKKQSDDKTSSILTIIVICIVMLFTEGSIFSTIIVLIFYYNRDSKVKMSIFYILLSLIVLTNPSESIYNNLFIVNYQWMMVFALPFMLMYNGERGRKSKYFFYIFYPVHIWILYIIGNYIAFK